MRKILAGENPFGEFGELNAIRQYFTQPNSWLKTLDSVVDKNWG